MRTVWVIAAREFKRYFATPAAYAVAFALFLIIGYLFYATILGAVTLAFGGAAPGVQIVISPLITLLLFVSPAITMHLLAEEQRLGTIELMLTAPVRDWELVVGKWLGAFLFLSTIILSTLIFPFILDSLTDPGIDQGLLISSYLGLLLFSAAIMAIGVAISAFFSNQLASFFATMIFMVMIWIIDAPSAAAGGNELLGYLNFPNHLYTTFMVGVIDIRDIVYYISMTAIFLFFGATVVETRRWR